ncbi:hypothetical protein CHU95_06865 [Niveispirillum lacus]|uniref:Uncharacterized protein n=1 Tax=Niveispirillum lacus TaxID=1981099 RepID=A0A255Z3F4_9PROT|nr:hypothetical protein [Niveispirillum lacus]OYQ35969.1 hypothetical protein CHU95_06865 [Niveispirillum lacus]
MRRHTILLALHALLLTPPAALSAPTAPPPESLREEQRLMVAGSEEVWQLVWVGPVRDYCEAVSPEVAITAPCAGFAYGEMGRLSLRRLRDGQVIDRFDPGPAFEAASELINGHREAGWSVLPRRTVKDDDYGRWLEDEGKFLKTVDRRPAITLMRFADYDRDGRSSEFLLQTDVEPGGKPLYAAIGLPAGRERLDFLRSTGHPERALMLNARAWAALRDQSGAAVVAHRACGDRGDETQSDYILSADTGKISVKLRETTCPDGSIISETDW